MALGPTKLKNEMKIRPNITVTSLFLLPLFKVPIIKLDEYGFINSYLYDKNKPDDLPNGKTIYVLFQPNEEQLILLQKQIEDWDNNGFLIGDYDYPGGYVVVTLKFPDKYKDQYKLFIKGQYSKFSTEFQDLIPKKIFTGSFTPAGLPVEEDSLQYRIINKRVMLKNYWEDQIGDEFDVEGEYWSKPDVQGKETMDVDAINEKRKQDEPRNN